MQYITFSESTELHNGGLYFYTETPGLYMLVRLIEHSNRDPMTSLSLEVLAHGHRKGGGPVQIFGRPINVSTRRDGEWNQIWRLFQLKSTTYEDAIIELQTENPINKNLVWSPNRDTSHAV